MEQEQQPHLDKFVKILGCLEFQISFGKEKHLAYLKGQKSSKVHWDFSITINGYTLERLVENRKKNDYQKYLEDLFIEYESLRDTESLKKYSRADCFDLLSKEISLLQRIQKGFFDDRNFLEEEDIPGYEGTSPMLPLTSHVEIKIIASDSKKYDSEDGFLRACISDFLRIHQRIIKNTLDLLDLRMKWLEYTNDQTFNSNTIDITQHFEPLIWCKNDTDLLELITALLEIKAINNQDHNLTRKEAIEIFSKIFNVEIKDAESKLSRATERKKGVSPFLSALKESFDNYAFKKEQK